MSLSAEQMEQVKRLVEQRMTELANQPLVVSVMGQTGVGKSSLINALFNTHFKTGAWRPVTKVVESVTITGKDNRKIIFNDMPGIGESRQADTKYLAEYRQYLLNSDIVLWAIHADNRSVAFDQQALESLLSGLSDSEKSALISRITFVLTKADLLSLPSWIVLDDRRTSVFTPDEAVENILREKERYYQEMFIEPYGSLIVSHTYNDVKFAINDPAFTVTQYSVYYKGMFSREKVEMYKTKYPRYADVFERLYQNYCVIPCSSLYKYNLTQLLLVVLNKLGKEAITRFKHFVDTNSLDQVSSERTRQLCNMVIFDQQSRRKVFDLRDGTFSVPYRR